MDEKTRKTWISIVIAGVIIVGMLAIAAVGGTAFFFYHHINARLTAQAEADQAFSAERARFSGQQPLIDVSRDDDAVIHRDREGTRRDFQALHALVYDANSRKLTHVDVPAWLLRVISAGGHLRLADLDVLGGDAQTKLTLEDLERHGPGLVMDVKRGRSELLVWTQ